MDKDGSEFGGISDDIFDESSAKDDSGSHDRKNKREFEIFSSLRDAKDFCTNRIQSSKYNVVTFLPLNLF